MKVIEQVKYKTVQYRNNIYVTVPETINYIAADYDGTVFGFEEEPKADQGWQFWDNPSCSEMFEICKVDLEGEDWTNTLVAL